MGIGFGLRFDQERLRVATLAAAFVLLGCVIGVLAAAIGGYGWFEHEQVSQQTTNLSPQEAEGIARRFGEEQLRLVEQASRAESKLPGGGPTAEAEPAAPGAVSTPLKTVESKFMGGDATVSATNARDGAWLFVFRVDGISVEEWRTHEAVLEIQVVVSDESGRILQSGTALFPKPPEKAAAIP